MAAERYGTSGEVKWGYRRAATLGSWWLRDGVLSARLLASDPVLIQQRPLRLVIPPRSLPPDLAALMEQRTGRAVPPGVALTRELVNVQIQGATLTASLRSD